MANPQTTPTSAQPQTEIPSGLGGKILQQGKPPEQFQKITYKDAKPGKYLVKVGSLTLGYDAKGDRVVAHNGALVQLSAEEAGPLVEAKTVEFANE